MRSLTAVPLALVLAAGCTGITPATDTGTPTDTATPIDTGPFDDWQPVSYVDTGTVCVAAGDPEYTVHVTVQDCMSSSCSRSFGGSCTVTVDGTDITVTSEIHWEDNRGQGVVCTDDCMIPRVACTMPALADGEYTVTLGGSSVTVTVPITDVCDPYAY